MRGLTESPRSARISTVNRGRYFSSTSSLINPPNSRKVTRVARRPTDDDGWFETDGMDHLAREVFEEIVPDSYDTGLLDSKGAPIHRAMWKNGIGFRAEVWWDENDG